MLQLGWGDLKGDIEWLCSFILYTMGLVVWFDSFLMVLEFGEHVFTVLKEFYGMLQTLQYRYVPRTIYRAQYFSCY